MALSLFIKLRVKNFMINRPLLKYNINIKWQILSHQSSESYLIKRNEFENNITRFQLRDSAINGWYVLL